MRRTRTSSGKHWSRPIPQLDEQTGNEQLRAEGAARGAPPADAGRRASDRDDTDTTEECPAADASEGQAPPRLRRPKGRQRWLREPSRRHGHRRRQRHKRRPPRGDAATLKLNKVSLQAATDKGERRIGDGTKSPRAVSWAPQLEQMLGPLSEQEELLAAAAALSRGAATSRDRLLRIDILVNGVRR